MLIRIREEERGAALIVALLVTFVVLLLSVFIMSLSIHNLTASSYDRKRVQSLTAAEAGINDFFNVLIHTAPEKLPCNSSGIGLHLGPVTGSVAVLPGTANYSVEVHYYDASTPQPAEISCSLLGQDKPPAAISITSTGTTDGTVPRKMQAYVNLIRQRSGGFNAAIVADKGLCLSGNFTLTDANGQSFAADMYVNSGNLCFGVQSAGNSSVGGKIYVHDGSASFGGNLTIKNDVWAWGPVTLQNSQTTVQGSATSSSSSLSGSGEIDANAKAGTTIDCSNKTPLASSCTSVSGNSGLVIKGQSILPNSPQDVHPPTATVPPVCWQPISGLDCQGTQAQWISLGYTIVNETNCTDAQNYLKNLTVATNTVVRVTGCADLVINQTTVNMSANLAIFTDGRILLDSKNTFTKTGGAGSLFFIAGYQPNVTPTSCLVPAQTYNPTTPYDIRFNNNPDYVNLKVGFYTPGAVIFNNQTKSNGFIGQILGGQVCSSNNFTMSFASVPAPGVSPISGFKQDVLWLREVK